MYLGIFLALILLILLAVLWMPLIFCIDTRTSSYYLRFGALAKASLLSDEEEFLRIRLRVFWMHFHFYPLRPRKAVEEPDKIPKKEKKKSRLPGKRTMLKLVRTFRVKKFDLDLDTGDSVLNAKLYPMYAITPFTIMNFRINFEGRNELALVIENRPIRIIKSFIHI